MDTTDMMILDGTDPGMVRGRDLGLTRSGHTEPTDQASTHIGIW